MKKRIIALLLVCLMVVSAVPAWVGAEETAVADAAGTSEEAVCPGKDVIHTSENCQGANFYKHVDPTCVEGGYTQFQCAVCGTVFQTATIPATGMHTLEALEDGKSPTCKDAGVAAKERCTTCGEVFGGEVIPATGHKWVVDPKNTTGDCTKGGTIAYVCSVCGETKTEEYAQGTANHIWNPNAEILSAPSCVGLGKQGLARYTCLLCGSTMDVPILPAECADLGLLVWKEHKADTCTADGYYSHWECSACHKEYGVLGADANKDSAEQKYTEITKYDPKTGALVPNGNVSIPKHAHKSADGKVLPSGLECGEKATCDECKQEFTGEHTPEMKNGKKVFKNNGKPGDAEPTCVKAGQYSNVCTRCDEVLETQTVAALSHTKWTDASTTERRWGKTPCLGSDGWRSYKCGRCGMTCTETVKSGAHGQKTYEIKPSCIVEGIKFTWCEYGSGCTASKYVIEEVGGKKVLNIEGRSWDITDLVNAQANKNYFLPVLDDSGAEKVYIAIVDYTIEKADGEAYYVNGVFQYWKADVGSHKWDVEVACEGVTTQTCTLCGAARKVAGGGHSYGYKVRDLGESGATVTEHEKGHFVAPTCTTPGYEEYFYCTKCGADHPDLHGQVISALGHHFVDYPAKDPTCTENGHKGGEICDRPGCGATQNVTVLPKYHTAGFADYVNSTNKVGENKIPNCGETGYTLWRCKQGNGCTVYKNGYFVDDYKIGGEHEFAEEAHTATNYKAASCTEDGFYTEVCKKCGAKRTVVVPATGHRNMLGELLVDDCRDTNPHRFCVNCETVIGRSHAEDAIKVDSKEPNCTDDGYTKKWCTNCGTVLENKTLQHTGHTSAWRTKVEATHTQDGVEEEYCTKCNEVLSTRTVNAIPGFDYVLSHENAVASGSQVYTNSSLVAVKVSLKSKGVGVNTLKFDLKYDKSVVTFVKAEFAETTQFINGQMANDNDGFVTVLMIAPNDENRHIADVNVTDEEVVTLYFRVISDTTASSATFSIDEGDKNTIDKTGKPVDYTGALTSITIGMLGDLNGDGEVNTVDAQMVMKMIIREMVDDEGVNVIYAVEADVDKNGTVDDNDLDAIYDYILRVISYEEFAALGTESAPQE